MSKLGKRLREHVKWARANEWEVPTTLAEDLEDAAKRVEEAEHENVLGGQKMKREIKPGVYRHFKGNLYRVLFIAQHTETEEKMVIYQALYGDCEYFARPYDMFASLVDGEKYPNCAQRYRFEEIKITE